MKRSQIRDRRAWEVVPGGTALVGYSEVKLGFYWEANGGTFAQLVGGGEMTKHPSETAAQDWLMEQTKDMKGAFA